jgi:hypothetical protein
MSRNRDNPTFGVSLKEDTLKIPNKNTFNMKTNFYSMLRAQSSGLLLSLLTICLLIAGCSSKKDDPVPQTKKEFLTAGTWKVSSFTSSDPLVQSFGALLVGSEYVFKADGTMTYTLLGVAGSPGKWEFATNETHIIFNKGSQDETNYEIVTLVNASMELKEVVGSLTSTTKYTKK